MKYKIIDTRLHKNEQVIQHLIQDEMNRSSSWYIYQPGYLSDKGETLYQVRDGESIRQITVPFVLELNTENPEVSINRIMKLALLK